MPRDESEANPSAGPVRRLAMRYWMALILVALAALFVVGLLIGLLLRRRRS